FVEKHEHLIYYVPLGVLAVAAIQGTFRFIEQFSVRMVGAAALRDLRNDMFEHVERQPLLYFQDHPSGLLIGRLINDVTIMESAFSQSFQSLISRTITAVTLVCVLLAQSWTLTLIALSIVSCIVLPVSVLGNKIRKSSRHGQERIGDLVAV